jgi:DNA polymerase I-like protein with 3'-5' exonuclease and polymerase domains
VTDYTPQVIAFDYEATGLDYWSPNFRVLSCAFAWRSEDGSIRTKVCYGKSEIESFLIRIPSGCGLIAHNVGYEFGVSHWHFKTACERIKFDTMRLVQVYDNGRDGEQKRAFRLDKCIKRILPDEPDHKAEAHEWIRANVPDVPKGKEGRYISQLPKDILERYNVGDAVATLKLYERLTDEFKRIGYDWTLDHSLYMETTKHIAIRRGKGVRVNREQLIQYKLEVENEIKAIDERFKAHFQVHISSIESDRKSRWIDGVKTERGKQKRRETVEAKRNMWEFNLKSPKQLAVLFVDTLGIKPQFTTPKGQPSFKSSHLPSWGEGGLMLAKRNKRLLVLQQTESLLELSQWDERYHIDMKTVGAATSRLAGGGYG